MRIKQISGMVVAGAVGIFLGATSVYAGRVVWPGHRHLQRAENQLMGAKAALEAASHDCGGHRVAAVKLVDQAMAEVREARAWANAHPEAFH